MFNIEYDILDEASIGDTKYRLVQAHGGKSKTIQLWSSLSKQWNVSRRYNVAEEWQKIKRYSQKKVDK